MDPYAIYTDDHVDVPHTIPDSIDVDDNLIDPPELGRRGRLPIAGAFEQLGVQISTRSIEDDRLRRSRRARTRELSAVGRCETARSSDVGRPSTATPADPRERFCSVVASPSDANAERKGRHRPEPTLHRVVTFGSDSWPPACRSHSAT